MPALRAGIRTTVLAVAASMVATGAAAADPIFTIAGGRLRGPTSRVQATDLALNGTAAVAAVPDGSYYIGGNDVLHVGPDGFAHLASEEPATAFAVRPDGSLLYGTTTVPTEAGPAYSAVRLLRLDGSVTTVAGRPFRASDNEPAPAPAPGTVRGDGGPATDAPLGPIGALAATADGGFLIGEASRVRRVRPDGTISTAAGGAPPPSGAAPGPDVPASQTTIGNPTELIARNDGSFLFSSGSTIAKVTADDRLALFAGGAQTSGAYGDGGPAKEAGFLEITGIASAPDGAVVVAEHSLLGSLDYSDLRRIAPDGIVTTVAGGAPFGSLPPGDIGDGREATSAPILDGRAVAVGADGGILWTSPTRVQRIGASGTGPMAVEINRVESTRVPQVVGYEATQAGPVTVDVLSEGRLLRRLSGAAQPGHNAIDIGGDLPPGRVLFRLTAARGGQLARDSISVLADGFLPVATARETAVLSTAGFGLLSMPFVDVEPARTENLDLPEVASSGQHIACRRWDPGRVDCAAVERTGRGRRRICISSAIAVFAGTDETRGGVVVRPYNCTGVRLMHRRARFGRPVLGAVP